MNKFLYIASFVIFYFVSVLNADESKLIIMRHGQGTHNLAKKYYSNPYHPNYVRSDLTEFGKQQVIETAQKLLKNGFNKETIDLVIVSPMPRTMQTANILLEQGLFAKEKMVIDSRLQEPLMGDLEGKEGHAIAWARMDHKSFGGETVEEIQKRIADVYRSIVGKGMNGHVLVITHCIPAHYLMFHITGEKYKLMTAEAKVIPLQPIASTSLPAEKRENEVLPMSACCPIILASQSAIRQKALNLLGLQYQCIPSHIDEKAIRDPDPYNMAVRIAEAKAREIGKSNQGIIVSGDAFLLHAGKVMEKPASVDEARAMLKDLSGSTYTFITSLVVYNTFTQQMDKTVESCSIQFRDLSNEEIEDYISKYPVTKFAGAHETEGAVRFAVKIEGNPNIFTALPMDKLTLFLRKNGVKI